MADEASTGIGQTGPVPFKVDSDGAGHKWPYGKLSFGPSGTQQHVEDTEAGRLPVKPNPIRATSVVAGRHEVATGTAAALPTVVARRFRLRALRSNSDVQTIDLGPSGVTAGAGWQMLPGDWDWFEVDNLNRIFGIASAAGQFIEYFGEV